MSQIVLGIGDIGVSKEGGSIIKTFALGSCVALILLDPVLRAVGMVHVALPESRINARKSQDKPGYFADTGTPALVREMTRLGCSNRRGSLVAKLVGGAKIMDDSEVFNIGKRNVLAIRKALWAQGLGPIAEDVGGNISRTVSVSVHSGEISIYCPGRGQWTL